MKHKIDDSVLNAYMKLHNIPFEHHIKSDINLGDIVNMVNAGGWGYHPINNGCLAVVEHITTRKIKQHKVMAISGRVLNPKVARHENFKNIPVVDRLDEVVFRLATDQEIQKYLIEK